MKIRSQKPTESRGIQQKTRFKIDANSSAPNKNLPTERQCQWKSLSR